MPLVSIVVPVYKVEKYLERCVNSLISQTLSDIEIILVDDGSPDKCGAMCDEFARHDSRIKVVHKLNGGLSSARNAGVLVATGKAVGFVDSDDDVELDMYQTLWECMEKHQVDMVMSDYLRVEKDKEWLKTTCLEEGYYNKEAIIKNIFPQLIMGKNLDYGPLLSVWHCLYDRKFLNDNNIVFDEEVRWSEDNIYSAIVGYCMNSFYYLKGKGLYHYYQNPGTITTSFRPGAWDVYCTMNRHLRKYFSVDTYDFTTQLALHQIYYACNCLGQLKKAEVSEKEKNEIRKKILESEQLKEAFREFRCPDNWPWKLKAQIIAIRYKLSFLLK